MAQLLQQPEGVLLLVGTTERLALSKPPARRSLVVAFNVDLIDDQAASRAHECGEMCARLIERADVVQRDHCNSRVEASGDFDQRTCLHAASLLRGWVDRRDVVASGIERLGELTSPCPDLQDP
jgi:hypothetical protein